MSYLSIHYAEKWVSEQGLPKSTDDLEDFASYILACVDIVKNVSDTKESNKIPAGSKGLVWLGDNDGRNDDIINGNSLRQKVEVTKKKDDTFVEDWLKANWASFNNAASAGRYCIQFSSDEDPDVEHLAHSVHNNADRYQNFFKEKGLYFKVVSGYKALGQKSRITFYWDKDKDDITDRDFCFSALR